MTWASKCPASATGPTHRDEVVSHWPTVTNYYREEEGLPTVFLVALLLLAATADKRNKLETKTIEIPTTSSNVKQGWESESTGLNNQSHNKVEVLTE